MTMARKMIISVTRIVINFEYNKGIETKKNKSNKSVIFPKMGIPFALLILRERDKLYALHLTERAETINLTYKMQSIRIGTIHRLHTRYSRSFLLLF